MTRPLTKRERAEAIVAQVRAKYPEPVIGDDLCSDGGNYCVGLAYQDAQRANPDWPLMCFFDCRQTLRPVAKLNDAGDFEAAWLALTDAIEAQL